MNRPQTACALCAGVGYVRGELPPGHPLFGQPITCPKCGKQAQLGALGKRWPVTAEQEAFGLTPFCDRADEGDLAKPAVLLAFQAAQCFIDGQPDNRLLALHGPPGCGKTHLLLIMRYQALKRELSTIYVTAPDLQKRIQQFDDNERRLRDWQDLTTVDLLLIDELDDLLGEKIQPRLLQLLNMRTSGNRATAFAFNRSACLSAPIRSRLQASQKWAPANLYKMRTGWLDLTRVPDARPALGFAPRPIGEKRRS